MDVTRCDMPNLAIRRYSETEAAKTETQQPAKLSRCRSASVAHSSVTIAPHDTMAQLTETHAERLPME